MLRYRSFKPPPKTLQLLHSFAIRTFALSNVTGAAQLPPRMVLKESDLEEAFLKGSGPGGQKINKTSSAVQLRHVPTGIIVKSQATRSRSQNRKIARQLLADKVELQEKGLESRTALKVEAKKKKKASKSKKARRKYKAQREEVDDENEEDNSDECKKEGMK